jgi:hypothetical protein
VSRNWLAASSAGSRKADLLRAQRHEERGLGPGIRDRGEQDDL